ncbi:hypothetical protein Tco_0717471, partial [Tanacetum coccineum]
MLGRGTKRRKSSKDAEPSKGLKSKESKSSSSSKCTQSPPKSSGKSTQAEEPELEAADTEMQHDQGNESGHVDDQPDNEAAPKHDWFLTSDQPLTLDRAWNKSKSIDSRPPHKWISTIAKARQPPRTFDELMDTPIDFLTYVMNCLKIDNLTQENLHNSEGREYPFDLSKPLPLIEDRGRQVVPVDYFINNDLKFLKGGSSSSKYTTSTTRTKAAKYDNIEGINDMVPTLWSPMKVAYKKQAVWGNISLEDIVVRRDDNVLYKFKEGDFPRLNLCDIKDMLLLLVQRKLSNLDVDDRYDLGVALRMSRIMVKAIDKLLFKRRLMRNLEKFVGERDYGNDLRLLEWTIQNRRDLPRDIPLDSVVVFRYEKKSKSENKGKVPTEMELVLEQTQQGTSYEVSVSGEGVEELKRTVKIK